jgi:pterin-4a-carbinolamine dehydratase
MKRSHIFVSYRRDDTAPFALALKLEFERCLQSVQVFVDNQRIEAATQWPDMILQALKQAGPVVAMIGPNWLAPDPATGRSRLFDAEDWVFKEIKYALDNPDNTIVPVLVAGAKPLNKNELPAELAKLCDIETFSIEMRTWTHDIARLCRLMAPKFGLQLRQDDYMYADADSFKAKTPPVSEERLAQALNDKNMEGWRVEGSDDPTDPDQSWLLKTYRFASFSDAMKFMNEMAEYCETIKHHPRWENVYREVRVRLANWDAKRRVTETDLTVAVEMNRVAQKFSA